MPDETAGRPDASILILGFNSLRYLDDCLGAIPTAARRHDVEVLFVNNGTDASEAFVAEHYPHVRVLKSDGNVGFAQANNRLAAAANGRFVILLNPDTKLHPEAIDLLIEAAESHPEYWLLGGVTVNAAGEFQMNAYPELPSIGAIGLSMIGRAGRMLTFDPGRDVQEVGAINGGFMLCEKQRWGALGGFDETYFLYGEDADICRRTRDRGGRIGLVQASKVFHDIGSGSAFSPVRQRFKAAGNAQYFRKHYPGASARLAIGMLWCDFLIRFSAGTLLSPWKKRFGEMSKGYAPIALRPWIWMRGFASTGADLRRGK